MDRRLFLASAAAALGLGTRGRAAEYEITLTEAEWRERLTPAQFAILREAETERAFSNSLMGESSDLLKENRAGLYHCAGCDLPVYSSETKYDSGTGWPSFWAPLEGAVGYSEDNFLIYTRTEVHCRRCGGHLGHVFDDGPPPTGKRHCLNALALTFTPA
ncbi:peptide-methionine (R)-S-oxide reductase MsrB [Maritimibacter sp. 55A14]|uniref:peptide-methionine (R)-S-oxide reductase MsrB n=1 Tax=Maritimibacter sp. 55A14 TaxID=2174844 RepID=UPI0018EE59A5|nr:peptide-methionine (R)-S-oxide reductase MsrB [Maritimibacter sp. 55A14]